MLDPSPAAAPLSPALGDKRHGRSSRTRIPFSGRSMPILVLGILVLLGTPSRFGSLVRADDTNDGSEFTWDENLTFDQVSVLPVSCINYNAGHMIKFELYKSENNYQCHFNQVGIFVVSIAHYMRAYFNYLAITNGKNFQLPGDAGYLNCVMLQETAYAENKLYAKIGCMDRQTFTSTKLQLHVYTDDQCSVKYDDGHTSKHHSTKGYNINGYTFSTHVSFRPPFYSCSECAPAAISETFNKKNTNWYDDDYISQNGQKNNANNANNAADDDDAAGDDYADDQNAYMNANDDVNGGNAAAGDDAAAVANDDAAAAANDDAAAAANDDGGNKYNNNDDYYKDDDAARRLAAPFREITAAKGQLEAYHDEFWQEVEGIRRSLNGNYYDIGDWNMCYQMYNYGVWCNADCQALDSFRLDEWSKSDIFLLAMMCSFMAAMMALVVAKRLRSNYKGRLYDDAGIKPGLSPLAVSVIFCIILTVIVVLAKLKFVNETLVFAVVTCILLFIYILKLTLFERRRPVLLAAPKHDALFDNPLDDRLFD